MFRTPLRQSSFRARSRPEHQCAALPSASGFCYIRSCSPLINKHRWWFLATTIAAVLLRLFFVLKLPVIAGDSLIYGDIAKCLINSHMFGIERASGWEPTLMRLPGYPFFLAFTFLIFGQDHYFGAMLFQLVFDVLTCFLVADIARRVLSERAARSAFLLAAFCPFLMSYVATPLTECLEIFFIAAAIDCAVVALDTRLLRWWTLCGVACAGAILLRPDGGLILGCIGLPMLLLMVREPARRRELLTATLLLAAVSLSPLVPWTIRNWRVFHVFQPLVTTHATDPGEYVPIGWERWFKTWLIDYASVEDVGFQVPGEPIDIGDIPDRAYTSAGPARARPLAARSIQRALRHDAGDGPPICGAGRGEHSPASHPLPSAAARRPDAWTCGSGRAAR